MKIRTNVKQAVPFFGVTDMAASVAFYVDGLGFTITKRWEPAGQLRWCWLDLGDAALMLQDFTADSGAVIKPEGKLGVGVNICFQCEDALEIYHEALARGLTPTRPFVGNGMWVTDLYDPDGYRLEFESPADAPEDTIYQGVI